MRVLGRALLLLVVIVGVAVLAAASSRHKRYLNFPYGSTLKVALSSKWSTLFDRKTSPAFWTQNFNWGISYDLPNGTQLLGPSGFGGLASRRHRRGLYRRLEAAIDSTGLLGRTCLLRAICEATQFLPPGDNVFAELVRIILWSPPDEGDVTPYDVAQDSGKGGHDCAELYRDCPVSVLTLLLSLRQSP